MVSGIRFMPYGRRIVIVSSSCKIQSGSFDTAFKRYVLGCHMDPASMLVRFQWIDFVEKYNLIFYAATGPY